MTKSAFTQTPIRDVRRARGRSLRSVAREAGIDPAHLSRIERGLAQPSVEVLGRLARILGLRELRELLKPYIGGSP